MNDGNVNFVDWFQDHVGNPDNYVDDQFLNSLAWGLINQVETYPKYFVNGYCFHISELASTRKTNNSGVSLIGEHRDYYGVLQEILVVEYPGLPTKRVTIFNCKWFDPTPSGTRICPKYGIVEVKSTRRYAGKDTFILAQQAEQVYFTPWPNPTNERRNWYSVIKTKSWRTIQSPDAPFQDDTNYTINELSELEEFDITLLDATNLGEEFNHTNIVGEEIYSSEDSEYDEDTTIDSDNTSSTSAPAPARVVGSSSQGEERLLVSGYGSSGQERSIVESESRLLICVDGVSFEPPEAGKRIPKIIKAKYDNLWIQWTQIPKEVKNMWFAEFKKYYRWAEEDEDAVFRLWKSKSSATVRSLFQDIRRGRSEASARNKKNAAANKNGRVNRSGAISISERVKRYEAKLGRKVSIPEVFESMNYDAKTDIWSSAESENIYHKFKKLKEDSLSQGKEIDDSELFFEVTEGSKGRYFGFGSELPRYASSSRSSTKNKGSQSSLVHSEQVNDRLDRLETANAHLLDVNAKLSAEIEELRSLILQKNNSVTFHSFSEAKEVSRLSISTKVHSIVNKGVQRNEDGIPHNINGDEIPHKTQSPQKMRAGIGISQYEWIRKVFEQYHALEGASQLNKKIEQMISDEDLLGLSEYVSGHIPGWLPLKPWYDYNKLVFVSHLDSDHWVTCVVSIPDHTITIYDSTWANWTKEIKKSRINFFVPLARILPQLLKYYGYWNCRTDLQPKYTK
ncbi:hypothetical protein C2S51_030838 [Perilla frutescens var. frutescens]|nr:hypothetical protein C2S51_030838 [Perilla frutescens var. frutescens]